MTVFVPINGRLGSWCVWHVTLPPFDEHSTPPPCGLFKYIRTHNLLSTRIWIGKSDLVCFFPYLNESSGLPRVSPLIWGKSFKHGMEYISRCHWGESAYVSWENFVTLAEGNPLNSFKVKSMCDIKCDNWWFRLETLN